MVLIRLLGVTALVIVAVIAGFAAGLGVIAVVNAISPFNEDVDEGTFREFWPVALAYATWALTSLVVVIGGVVKWLRWSERER